MKETAGGVEGQAGQGYLGIVLHPHAQQHRIHPGLRGEYPREDVVGSYFEP